MKYCNVCKQNVTPIKRNFSFFWFTITFGIFYIPYHLFLKRKFCPICRKRRLEHKHSQVKATY